MRRRFGPLAALLMVLAALGAASPARAGLFSGDAQKDQGKGKDKDKTPPTTSGGASTPAEGDDVVALPKDKDESTDLRKFFGDAYRGLVRGAKHSGVEASVDLFSLQYFRIGAIAGTRLLDIDEVEHDVDKLYLGGPSGPGSASATRAWKEITIGSQIAVPANLTLSNLIGPLGLNIGLEGDARQKLTLVVPTSQPVDEPVGNAVKELWHATRRMVDAVRGIRIPRNAMAIARKYPPGSEIRHLGAAGLVTRLGASLGVPVVNANLDVFALVSGTFERRLKVLNGEGRNLIRLDIRNVRELDAGTDASLRLGVTVFRSSLVDGTLFLDLLSARHVNTRAQSTVYDYTYDLSYPEAASALTLAMAGDLRKTQELAIFRDGESRYRGVIINEQNTGAVRSAINEKTLGFTVDESLVHSILGDGTFNETFGGFLSYGTSETDSIVKDESEGYFEEREKLVSFKHDGRRGYNVLWGLIGSDTRTMSATASVSYSEGIGEDGKPAPFLLDHLDVSHTRVRKKDGGKLIHSFLADSAATLAATEPAVASVAVEALDSGRCSSRKPSTYQVDLSMAGEPIHRIAMHQEGYVWWVIAKVLNAPVPFDLTVPELRNSAIEETSRPVAKVLRRLEDRFMPAWRAMRAIQTGPVPPGGETERDFRLARATRDLIKAWGEDPLAARLLAVLGQPANPKASPARPQNPWDHASLRMRLKSERCSYDWTVESPRIEDQPSASPIHVIYEWNDEDDPINSK